MRGPSASWLSASRRLTPNTPTRHTNNRLEKASRDLAGPDQSQRVRVVAFARRFRHARVRCQPTASGPFPGDRLPRSADPALFGDDGSGSFAVRRRPSPPRQPLHVVRGRPPQATNSEAPSPVGPQERLVTFTLTGAPVVDIIGRRRSAAGFRPVGADRESITHPGVAASASHTSSIRMTGALAASRFRQVAREANA